MRTTLTLNEGLAKALKALAYRQGKSFKQVVNDTLQAGLDASRARAKAKPYKLKPVSLGGPLPGYDLTKSLQLADAIEDEEIARKMNLKK